MMMDERKRPYNSLKRDGECREPTEEEMEAYKLKRARRWQEDPMAAYLYTRGPHGCSICHFYQPIKQH